MYFLGVTFLQGCLSWIAGHLWMLTRWSRELFHHVCSDLCFFCFISDPGVSDPCIESHYTFSTGFLCFYNSLWIFDIGKLTRYVTINPCLSVIVNFDIKKTFLFYNIIYNIIFYNISQIINMFAIPSLHLKSIFSSFHGACVVLVTFEQQIDDDQHWSIWDWSDSAPPLFNGP